ncbi:pyruvate formate lyase family protein [Desulfocastanea catecholica]
MPRPKLVNPIVMRNLTVLTPRLKKLKKEYEDAPVVVCPESSFSFTKSYSETEGLPLPLRYSMAFKTIMEETPILLREGELIAGSLTKAIRGADVLACECPLQILAAVKKGKFTRKMSEWTEADIDPEDVDRLRKDAEYWAERLPVNEVNKRLIEELGEEHMDIMMDRAMVLEGIPLRADPEMGIWGPMFPETIGRGRTGYRGRIVHKGLNNVIADCKAELKKMDAEGAFINPAHNPKPYDKRALLKAMIISCEAVITWAKRYAELARTQAAQAKDPQRKKELEKIAANCEWVPANPPRDYWECVQSIRFLHAAAQKEKPFRKESSLGQLDQDLYPYYEKDIAAGKITRNEAAELLGCFWLKTREGEGYDPEDRKVAHSQGTFLPNVTICGRNEKGDDWTNECSWLILKVMAEMKFSEPTVYIRYHDGMKNDFLLFALEANMEHRGGCPAFLDDESGTRRFVARGIPLSEACQWNASGCLSYHLECAQHIGGFQHLNQMKILEVALHNGYDPRTKKQVGPKTGEVTKMTSLEEIMDAYFKQEDHFAWRLNRDYEIRQSYELNHPLVSGLNCSYFWDTAIPYGLHPLKGGTPYPITTVMWVGDRGTTDVAEVFAAIKYVVFDQKKATMEELMTAIKANWEGYEDLRELCLKAPKYGNDDEYIDDIFEYVQEKNSEIMQKRPDPITGLKPFLFKGAASAHVVVGMVTGALPNGRKAGTPVNDGALSAKPGADVNGPSALLNSASRFNFWQYVGGVLNMKFTKDLLNTPEKLTNLIALLRTFFENNGWHIQFNIHSQEELIEAQKKPDEYKNLLVRVGGYSANFVDLPGSLQDEIIARTPHSA